MTTITCDECGGHTVPDMAVHGRLQHYADPEHWVTLVILCQPCAVVKGWRSDSTDPMLSTERQFLQLTSR